MRAAVVAPCELCRSVSALACAAQSKDNRKRVRLYVNAVRRGKLVQPARVMELKDKLSLHGADPRRCFTAMVRYVRESELDVQSRAATTAAADAGNRR